MNYRHFLIYFVLLALGFYAGYMASVHDIFDNDIFNNDKNSDALSLEQASELNPKPNPDQNKLGENKLPQHAWQHIDPGTGKLIVADGQTNAASADTNDGTDPEGQSTPDSFDWQNRGDIISMFEQMMALSDPVTNEEITVFSQAIDEFRAALVNSDADVASLLEHMSAIDPNSKEFGYIVSLIAALPDQRGYEALEDVALTLAQSNEQRSVDKFLDILGSSYSGTDNPEVVSALMDIALYSEFEDTTKLNALDYLHPFQISSVEKQEIQSNLSTLLDEAPMYEKSTYLNHILRFSNQDEKLELAQRYLAQEQNQELRTTIIDKLAYGAVPRTESLRETLMTIATSPDDPLQVYAQHTLMYSFDISNEEYLRLKQ